MISPDRLLKDALKIAPPRKVDVKGVAWDLLLHLILKRLEEDAEFSSSYLFKGGTCLAKCYLNYHRFSWDLDFTYSDPSRWRDLTRRERREALVSEARSAVSSVKDIIGEIEFLSFEPELSGRRIDEEWVTFGSGSRMITMKVRCISPELGRDLLKIQVNLDELLLFEPKSVVARPFKEFGEYRGIPLRAYNLKEILVEKVRALLTRRGAVARDLFDIITLEMRRGLRAGDFRKEILEKIRFALKYERYRERLAPNLDGLVNMSGKELLKLLEVEGISVRDATRDKFLRRFRELKEFLATMRDDLVASDPAHQG